MDPGIKHRICWSVLSSVTMKANGIQPVNLYKWYSYWEFKMASPDFLKEEEDDKQTQLRTGFEFPNKRRVVRVKLIEQDVEENAFMCVGFDAFITYVAYYISDEYDLNFTSAHSVPGRFVFKRENSNSNKIEVLFLAKEPAKVIADCQDQVEDMYLESRFIEKTGKKDYI